MELKQYRFLIFCIIILTGCGPAAKLRRAEKLIAKAEQQGAFWKSDTVFIEKQIITRERHIDTLIQRVDFRDTITVIRDNVVTKVKINTVTKEVFVSTKVPADTIRVEVPVIVNKTIKAGKGFWYYAIRGLLLAILAFVAGYLLRAKTGKDLTIRFDKDQEGVK